MGNVTLATEPQENLISAEETLAVIDDSSGNNATGNTVDSAKATDTDALNREEYSAKVRAAQSEVLANAEIADRLKATVDQFVDHIGASFNAVKDTAGIQSRGKQYVPVALAYSMVRNSAYVGLLQQRHPKDTRIGKGGRSTRSKR